MTTNGTRIEDTKPATTWERIQAMRKEQERLRAVAREANAATYAIDADVGLMTGDLPERIEFYRALAAHTANPDDEAAAERWEKADAALDARYEADEAAKQAPRSHVTTVLDPEGREVEVEPQH